MLFQLNIKYKNGEEETKIVYSNDEESVSKYRDTAMIDFSYKPFKYYIKKHRYLPKAIIRFPNKTMIYPEGIECHPKTALDDIVIKD